MRHKALRPLLAIAPALGLGSTLTPTLAAQPNTTTEPEDSAAAPPPRPHCAPLPHNRSNSGQCTHDPDPISVKFSPHPCRLNASRCRLAS
ncbi:hypothetical protein Csp1_10800 [Corynebacterium provencense]|uniref:Uncharacterized protein n=1 Tax=Corynebacterium provencense TaxID=1737425 RepID=A0A2Z3YM86_9CORY|nr:hypothetical protein Csp1_10800 [Corynebacterium provencense]